MIRCFFVITASLFLLIYSPVAIRGEEPHYPRGITVRMTRRAAHTVTVAMDREHSVKGAGDQREVVQPGRGATPSRR
jgi:hypothetical protein